MGEVLLKVVFALFAVLGMVEAFRLFALWLLKTKNPGKLHLIVRMDGHDEEAELVLRSACERVRWLPGGGAEVLVIDCGMDEETRRICDMACADLPEVQLCRPDEIEKIICR